MLTQGDILFLRDAMRKFKITSLRLTSSDSKLKHPDIWCDPDVEPPIITVTKEWMRQGAAERRKRLTHELMHIAWRLQHNDLIGYSTYPARDIFSRLVYRDLVAGRLNSKQYYLRKAMMGAIK